MIELTNVSKTYPNGTKGLNQISLSISQGEFVVIVGLSGAGKSTLLRAMNRLHDITEGDIRIGGKSITNASGQQLRSIRRDIGMIFQSFNLVKRSTVLRNVMAGRVGYHSTLRTVLGLFPKEDTDIAFEALSRVNIAEKAYVRADQLSGGQQQRVAIARVLAQEAKIILADEPVASLDPLTTKQVMDDLKESTRSWALRRSSICISSTWPEPTPLGSSGSEREKSSLTAPYPRQRTRSSLPFTVVRFNRTNCWRSGSYERQAKHPYPRAPEGP